MKQRITGIITGIVLLLLAFTVSAFAYNTGDIDGNGKHTAADARMVLRYSAKLDSLSEEQQKNADVDNNGKITAADARLILRVSAKLDKPFGEIDPAAHLLVQSRKYAGCKTLTGTVKPVIIFVNDPNSRWTEAEKQAAINSCNEVVNEILRQAALYGQRPIIRAEYKTAEISCRVDDDGWETAALKGAGLPFEGVVNDALEKLYGVDEAPIVYMVNQTGRAYAVGGSATEHIVLFKSADGLFHELCHVFGAPDYYYPDTVNRAAKDVFPDSIMDGGKEVDDLTAYNIGWTDTLSESAMEFLKQTAYVTEKDIADALNREWFTGYATDWVTDSGVYTGYIQDGMFHGQGSITYTSGARYEGSWNAGIYDGYGVLFYADGSKYDGYWNDGKQEGYGVLFYNSGAKYDGYWKNSKMDGYGVFTYSDGSVYDGYWKADQKEGQGTLTYADGSRYAGGWLNGTMNGYGIYYFYNGDVFAGNWYGGVQHGYGTYTFSSGRTISGTWQNGVYIG